MSKVAMARFSMLLTGYGLQCTQCCKSKDTIMSKVVMAKFSMLLTGYRLSIKLIV